MSKWTVKDNTTHGSIVDEHGFTIAGEVASKKHAALIAAAPLQHDALKLAEHYLAKRVGHLPTSEGYKVLTAIREAIAAGETP